MAAARQHGVSILGTIITEWEEGKQQLESVLSDPVKLDRFVQVNRQTIQAQAAILYI